jgi:hypothetical protein
MSQSKSSHYGNSFIHISDETLNNHVVGFLADGGLRMLFIWRCVRKNNTEIAQLPLDAVMCAMKKTFPFITNWPDDRGSAFLVEMARRFISDTPPFTVSSTAVTLHQIVDSLRTAMLFVFSSMTKFIAFMIRNGSCYRLMSSNAGRKQALKVLADLNDDNVVISDAMQTNIHILREILHTCWAVDYIDGEFVIAGWAH